MNRHLHHGEHKSKASRPAIGLTLRQKIILAIILTLFALRVAMDKGGTAAVSPNGSRFGPWTIGPGWPPK